MDRLTQILTELDPGKLARAPTTERGAFPPGGSLYKPTLLIVVLSRILDRHPAFRTPEVYFDDVARDFQRLHERLLPDAKLKVAEDTAAQPFWKLGAGTPPLWTLLPREDQSAALKEEMDKPSGHQIRTAAKLNHLVKCAQFESDKWDVLSEPLQCEAVISFLLASYFRAIDSPRGLRTRIHQALSI